MSAPALEAVRAALAGRQAWLVGGVVRDRLLGRQTGDVDVVIDGDTEQAAHAIARAAGGAARFALSEGHGSWRVVAREGAWQVDVERMRAGSLAEDLALRDFTINAIAQPLDGEELIDPTGGVGDLRAGRLRMAGPGAFDDDPLRVLRLVRLFAELGFEPERETARAAGEQAWALERVSAERVFIELRRIVAAPRARAALELMGEVGAGRVVLPELEALRGIEQSRYHHTDVYGHTLEVLERTIELETPGDELAEAIGPHRQALAGLLAEPLADEQTRAQALRWGALLHDAAKPATRQVRPGDGRVTFMGHDALGAELARTVLGRLRASERLTNHVAALVRHHLRLGFLVHEPQPLAPRTVYAYLRACSPVEVDVTLLSVADRLATRGDRAPESIAAHLDLARRMLADALRWRRSGSPRPLLRGDELARELGIATGPLLGRLLEELSEAQYAGEVRDRAQAIAHARAMLQSV